VKRALSGKKSLAPGPVDRILDVGCASGAMLEALPQAGYKAGVDICEEHIRLAQEKGIDAHLCDLEDSDLPFEDESFDAVVCTETIEHVLNTDRMINEINRVLKTGGVLAASVPNIAQPASFLLLMLDLTPMYSARYRNLHYRDFTGRLFRQILRKHGFDIRRCEGSYLFPFEHHRWGSILPRFFPRLGAQTLVACTKAATVTVKEGHSSSMPELLKWLKKRAD
jgi:ubiquinone/menaquinone biosynthesis C-methylase UbiE